MGLFSGIMVNTTENNGYELSLEDVRIEFNQAFEVLNTEAANFESFCGAIERLEMLNKSIQDNNGKADKGIVAFLNHNNSLAEALGISLDMEDYDGVVVGSELSVACEGVLGDAWEAIKKFFKRIFDGIASFFNWIGGFFESTEKRLNQVIDNGAAQPAQAAQPVQDTAKETAQKSMYPGPVNGICCIQKDKLFGKLNVLKEFFKAKENILKATDAKSALAAMTGTPDDRNINNFAAQLGIELDKQGNPTGSKPMFQATDFAIGEDRGKAFANAGWKDPVTSAQELIKLLREVREISKAIDNGKKLCGEFANMKEENFNKDTAGTDFKAAQGIGKWFIRCSSIIGTFAKAIDAISVDLLNASKAYHKDVKAATKAAEEAQKKADEAKQNIGKV